MKATKKAGNSYPPIPAGTHQAVIYGIIDEGTQYSEKYNKSSPKVRVLFELPKVRIDIEKEGEVTVNVPRVTSQEYTLSLHEKSGLSIACASLLGRGWTEDEIEFGYDPKGLMGINCLLQVVHKHKDKKTYANINGIVSLPEGMPELKAEIETIWYDMEEHGFSFPEKMHDWIADIIKQSAEYKEHTQPSGANPEYDGNYIPPDDSVPF